SSERRQSCKMGGGVGMMILFGGDGISERRRPRSALAREGCGVEIVDGDHARREIAKLGKLPRFVRRDDRLALGLGDPIIVVVAPNVALANGALELLVGLVESDDFFQRMFEQADPVIRV